MGGLTRGRVRATKKKRDPEKEIAFVNSKPGSKSNTGAGEI